MNFRICSLLLVTIFVQLAQAKLFDWGKLRKATRNTVNVTVDLENYLQPDNIEPSSQDNIDRLCARNCLALSAPRICYYKFIVEQYHAMGPACEECPLIQEHCHNPQCVTADGMEKTVLTVNRMLPGPSLQVCEGDRIIVDVHNKMPARSLSIHWHGILQKESPWMDGVPYLTQCPIEEGQTFRYDFIADTSGTHFWHAHSGFQMFDGISGPLIVRETQNPVHNDLYAFDNFSHTIFIQDWIHLMSDNKYPGYNKNETLITLKADTYLINGRGSFMKSEQKSTGTPLTRFIVKPNTRHLFRIISATSLTCPCTVAFEHHSMLVIAADGHPIEPVKVGSITLGGGDRFDVIINTDQISNSYWIRVQGRDFECEHASQSAFMQYEDSVITVPDHESTLELIRELNLKELNNPRHGCNPENDLQTCMDKLRSASYTSDIALAEPHKTIFISAGAYEYTVDELYKTNTFHRFYIPFRGPVPGLDIGGMYADTFNDISCVMPPFPLLTQEGTIPEENICPTDRSVCKQHICECVNIETVPLNAIIEIVFTDDTGDDLVKFDHPMHIHGHQFVILKQGSKSERSQDNFHRRFQFNDRPIIKDTVAVPADGFAVVRFRATNPGIWALHCHFLFHNHNGMSLILQVGNRKQFMSIPDGLPQCGNYLPPVTVKTENRSWRN